MIRCQKCNKRILWFWNKSEVSPIPQFIDPYQINQDNIKYLDRHLTNKEYYHKNCNPYRILIDVLNNQIKKVK